MLRRSLIVTLGSLLVAGAAAQSPCPTPVVAAIAPASGPTFGGVAVTLTGSGFTGATTVTFGGVAATSVVVVDDATITATTPAGAVGPTTIAVANGCGGLGSLAGGYVYETGFVIATNTTVGASNFAYDFAHLRVNGGATLTMDGDHFLLSLDVLSGGVVTHPHNSAEGGLQLTVIGNATVRAGSAISADFRGSPAGQGAGAGGNSNAGCCGSGGGGHGGNGGYGAYPSFPGGTTHGSVTQPTSFGGGAGLYLGVVPPVNSGLGAGGGAIRLVVGGTLVVDGVVGADGRSLASAGGYTNGAGSGAGGSIWITAQSFAGSGVIRADGGSGWGGGGGGRLAVETAVNAYSGALRARGGSAWAPAGAGTVYLKPLAGGGVPSLTVDNGGVANNAGTEFVGPFDFVGDVVVSGAAIVTHPHNFAPGLDWTISGSVTVAAGAWISADRRGSPAGQGAGVGSNSPACCGSGGGGHGGNGAFGSYPNYPGGTTHGSVTQPTAFGGGAGIYNGLVPGVASGFGAGGGAIRLVVGGVLTVDGSISADGSSQNAVNYGSGAGGSVWITAQSLTGSGVVRADGGGLVTSWWGSGGGGRIALEAINSSAFVGQLQARGGLGGARGGAGTVYVKPLAGGGVPSLIVDNGGVANNAGTEFVGPFDFVGDVVVSGAAYVTHPHNLPGGLDWNVSGSVTVASGAAISADYRGSPAGQGAGAGDNSNAGCCGSGGGGHGGNGGYGAYPSFPGGTTHGSVTQPTSFGGGAGLYLGVVPPVNSGLGAGGGAIRLVVGGALVVDGVVGADGRSLASAGGYQNGAGSGAGGSVWITAQSLAGAGVIRADGGSGWGGGGGGRVAVEYVASTFSGGMRARGGSAWAAAGAGTVYVRPLAGGAAPTLVVDNGGVANNAGTEFAGPFDFDGDVVVSGAAFVTHPHNFPGGLQWNVSGSLTVTTGASISADFRGSPAGQGLGAGGNSNAGCCGSGGGGHGGNGAYGSYPSFPGGATHGSPTQPTAFGGGAGLYLGVVPPVNSGLGAGGGAIRLVVGGALVVDGVVGADGRSVASAGGYQNGAGSGAGGSIWIDAPSLAGSGVIRADGGSGWGGGGGGRIALYIADCSVGFSGTVRTLGGAGGFPSAQNGTVYRPSRCNVHVGPNGAFADLQTAVNAVVTGDVTFVVAPGVYAPFNVTLNTARALRFVAEDPNAPPVVDTATAGPVTVAGTSAAAFVSFEDFVFGSPTSQNPALKFDAFAGVGMVERCTLEAETAPAATPRPALWIVDALGVGGQGISVQRSSLGGFPGLLADGPVRAFVHNGALVDVVALPGAAGAANVVVAGSTPAALAVPPATIAVDSALAPELDTPRVLVPGDPFVVTVVGQPGHLWSWAFGPAAGFSVFGPPFTGPLLLDLATFSVAPTVGVLDAKGVGSFVYPTPSSLPLLGSTLFVHAADIDPVTGAFVFSNLQVAQGGF